VTGLLANAAGTGQSSLVFKDSSVRYATRFDR
jgi:hypothetical protein